MTRAEESRRNEALDEESRLRDEIALMREADSTRATRAEVERDRLQKRADVLEEAILEVLAGGYVLTKASELVLRTAIEREGEGDE